MEHIFAGIWAVPLKRPAFDRLQKAIFAGTVTTVVVWKLDRISRGQRDGVNLLADWCERGVRVVAVTQQIDLSGPVGRMVASVLFGLAEIETEYCRERQAAGIVAAKQRGVYRGRDQGSTKAPPSRARELRGRGLTVQEIATALGISRRTASGTWLRHQRPEPRESLNLARKRVQARQPSISRMDSPYSSFSSVATHAPRSSSWEKLPSRTSMRSST